MPSCNQRQNSLPTSFFPLKQKETLHLSQRQVTHSKNPPLPQNKNKNKNNRKETTAEIKMPKTKLKPVTTLFVVLIFLHTHLEFCSSVPILGLDSLKTGELEAIVGRVCAGKIGECAVEEAEMDSESNRRVLVMQRRYISYDTLKRDLTPCTRPGASYYNCKAAGQANPYNRGCEVITGCARNIKS